MGAKAPGVQKHRGSGSCLLKRLRICFQQFDWSGLARAGSAGDRQMLMVIGVTGARGREVHAVQPTPRLFIVLD